MIEATWLLMPGFCTRIALWSRFDVPTRTGAALRSTGRRRVRRWTDVDPFERPAVEASVHDR